MAHIQPGKTEDICKKSKLFKGQGEEEWGKGRGGGKKVNLDIIAVVLVWSLSHV